MATTEHFYAGTGTQTSFPFEFPYLTESDVFVELYNSSTGNFDLKQQNTSGQNNDYSISNTNIVFNTAPPQIAGVNNIHIYRNTDVETAKAVYNTGSAIRAQDLNNNTDQALYKLQEGTQLITTGDIKDEAIDSSKIKDGTIVNTDISPTAEIAVNKLADGSARQLLQTDAAGTGVEWTSNVDVPGTLDVTGNTDLDGTLNVDGNATFLGNINANGTTTISTADINGGTIDGISIGLNTPATHVGCDSFLCDFIVANHDVLGTYGGYNLQLSSYGGNAYSSSGNNYAAQTTRVMENLAVDGNLSVIGSISGGSIDATSLATIPAANFVRADQGDVLTGNAYTFEGQLPNTSIVNYAIIRGRDLKLEFGNNGLVESNLSQAHTMQIQAQRHGVMDNSGNYASINDINLGAGNLGLPWGSSELNSNQIGHVSRISLGRAYMTVAKANNVYSTNQLVMRASYPDGLMFYHPDTATTGAEYYLSGSNMPGDATYGNSYEDNITEARNNADMRIIQGGILAKNKVEIGSSTVTGTLQISGTDVTATATELNKLDGYTGTTTELNKLDGYTGSTADLNEVVTGKNVVETITGSATDAQLPTAQAVNERIVELVTEVGGFHPIANETSFPTTNPDINDGAGTIVSLKALSSAFSTGSGVTTHTFTNGAGSGVNVIINGLPASTTFQAGKGLLLETTTTLHTYNYHRLVLDESGVSNADALVSAFNERYYGPHAANQSTRPSGANRVNGDLYFNTSDGKMKVFNGSHASGTWDDVAAPGNFFINTLSSSSGSGGGQSAFNGVATRFTLSNPPLTAQQLLVSVNGVIQKPNSGTSPSEGFAIDSADIIFASAPATGAPYFIVTIGSSVNIGTPSNDTVGAAQIIDGSISNAEISSSAAIAKSKLASLDIVNADVNASAAIAGTKISPDFGSQNVVTTGTVGTGVLTVADASGSDPTMQINHSAADVTGEFIRVGRTDLPAIRYHSIKAKHSGGAAGNILSFNIHDTSTTTSQTEVLTLLGSGRVGIGTETPQRQLHVLSSTGDALVRITSADGNAAYIELGDASDGDAGKIVYDSANNLTFSTADSGSTTEKLRITSAGKVGIGTTSPSTKFEVRDGSATGISSRSTSTQATDGNKALKIRNNSDTDTFNVSYKGQGYFAGKLGIGTTSPQSDIHIGASGGDDNNSIRIDGTNNTSGGQVHRFVIENQGESALVNFKTSAANGTETTKVSIKSITGDIGIGTTTPTEKVHVAGGNVRISGASGGTLVLGGSSAHTSKLVIGSNDGTTNGNLLIEGGDGTDFITISSGGNVEIHDGNLKVASGHGIDFSATSDATGKSSEKLDDYEEGTWTPTYYFNGTVASTQPSGSTGYYTRIGDRVFISCHISGNAVGTFSGYFQIGGLPFNAASGKYTALCGWVYSGFDDNHKIIFRTNPNADKIEVQYAGSSVFTSNMNHTANYMIGGNYPV